MNKQAVCPLLWLALSVPGNSGLLETLSSGPSSLIATAAQAETITNDIHYISVERTRRQVKRPLGRNDSIGILTGTVVVCYHWITTRAGKAARVAAHKVPYGVNHRQQQYQRNYDAQMGENS